MNFVYILATGAYDPTRASLPLHLAANGSLEVGQEPAVIIAGDGADLIVEDHLQRMEGVGLPPARELVAKLKEHEVPIYV